MSPKRELSQYRVYLWKRNRPKAVAANCTLGTDEIPSTWEDGGKSYFWSATDDILGIIIFSEQDPRT